MLRLCLVTGRFSVGQVRGGAPRYSSIRLIIDWLTCLVINSDCDEYFFPMEGS